MVAAFSRARADTDALHERIRELESMLRSKSAMLEEIARAAGYRLGEQYSAAGIIARLLDRDR